MGLTISQILTLVIAGAYVLASGLLLPRGLTATKPPGTSVRQRVLARGLSLALLPDLLFLAGLVLLAGLSGPDKAFGVVALPALALALWAFAPRYVTSKVLPLTLVALGLDGLARAEMFAAPPPWGGMPGQYGFGDPVPYTRGPTATLVQAWAFIVVGLWLAWRRMDPHSRPYQLIFYEPARVRDRIVGGRSRREPRGRGRPRWGLVLLLVAILLCERLPGLIGNPSLSISWWLLPMTVLLGAATFVVFRFPWVAGDLAITGLIAFGLYGIKIVATMSLITHPVAYGVFMIEYGDRWASLAGAQGLALVAAGIWLLPRALDDRTKALLRPTADRELAGRVARLTQTRADAVDSAAAELRRVERDLHDGAQARLVALGIILRGAERLIHSSPDAAAELVAQARESSLTALGELRDLVRGIRPPVLADRGLADAVQALALDTPLRTVVDVDLPGRPELALESACYFAVAELLANAVKHSGARQAQVQIGHDADVLLITVTDDGAGGADPSRGTGLVGLERRLATFDGVLAISSPPGGPTIAAIEVPCALSSLKTSTC